MSRLIILKNQFEELAKAKGNSKKPLMKTFVQDPESGSLFIEVYNFVFNPFITTGIAKKKFDKCQVEKIEGIPQKFDIINMLSYIESNNTGSDYVVSFLKRWILEQPEETHEFLKGVFTKDLQLGISEKGLNEALGYEHIPIHEIMLAKKWEREEHKVKGDFFVTLKMDDYRTTCIYDEEQQRWELKARSGFNFEGVHEIEAFLNNLPKDMVFDGGLISTDSTLEAKDRFRHTGKLLKTIGPKTGLMFYVYDMLPYEEYKKGKSKLGYKNRQLKIIELFSRFNNDQFKNLFLPVEKLYYGDDKEVIFPMLEEVLAKKFEGLMVNTADGKYETKRTDQLLKVKEFYNIDLRVVDTYEYKHPGKLGGFICEYKDGGTVRVGGGFKLHEREAWWPIKDEMVGKIIEVRYFQESTNQNGKKSIRHGHFVGLREDKNEVSYD